MVISPDDTRAVQGVCVHFSRVLQHNAQDSPGGPELVLTPQVLTNLGPWSWVGSLSQPELLEYWTRSQVSATVNINQLFGWLVANKVANKNPVVTCSKQPRKLIRNTDAYCALKYCEITIWKLIFELLDAGLKG